MDNSIATIYKFNSEFSELSVISETINYKNIEEATKSFTIWAHELTHKKFQIVSNRLDFTIVFTIYSRGSQDSLYYIVILDIVLDTVACTGSYKILNQIKDIDIENMSDIVSIFIKKCTNEITCPNKSTMIDLINLRMTTIATKVE